MPGGNRRALDDLKVIAAQRLLLDQASRGELPAIRDAEFKVFSQFGDDGIIQYLLRQVGADVPQTFIEFGVENYREANTRFLLVHDNWRGLVLDGAASNIKQIERDEVFWQHDLTARSAFITRDNINALFEDAGFVGEIGLLSIDIDGNDYWVWDAIDVVDPVIVVVEYNAVFGPDARVTVPYDPAFERSKAHYSNLFFGASLAALSDLGDKRGYALVGCNSAGNNAYFVRRKSLGPLAELTCREAFVESRFRESRDRNGRLSFLAGESRLRAVEDLVVYDLTAGRVASLRSVLEKAAHPPSEV